MNRMTITSSNDVANANTLPVATAGAINGRVTRRNVVHGRAEAGRGAQQALVERQQ